MFWKLDTKVGKGERARLGQVGPYWPRKSFCKPRIPDFCCLWRKRLGEIPPEPEWHKAILNAAIWRELVAALFIYRSFGYTLSLQMAAFVQ